MLDVSRPSSQELASDIWHPASAFSSYHEPRRRDDGAGFGVVVVVELRGRGERVETVARAELEIEPSAAARGPEIDDEAVGQNVVAADRPARLLHRVFERGAVNVRAGRQSHLGEHHAVAAVPDALGLDAARHLLVDRRRWAV